MTPTAFTSSNHSLRNSPLLATEVASHAHFLADFV